MKFSFDISSYNAIVLGNDKFSQYSRDFNLQDFNSIEKRRLSTPAKAIFSLASDINLNAPIIFSSINGEINRQMSLLWGLRNENFISPTSFSLSVHNALVANLSIKYNINQEIQVLCCDAELECGLLNAYTLLHEGHDRVIVITLYEDSQKEWFFQGKMLYAGIFEVVKSDRICIEILPNDKIIDRFSTLKFLQNYDKNGWDFKDKGNLYRWHIKY